MAAKKPPRKEFDPKSVKQGIADPGLGRIARGAAAVGRAAYKAGSVRAVGPSTLARMTASKTGANVRYKSSGVGARKIKVRDRSGLSSDARPQPQQKVVTNQGNVGSVRGREFPSVHSARRADQKAGLVDKPTMGTRYPTGTGRRTNKKANPTATVSQAPKKQSGVGARKKK